MSLEMPTAPDAGVPTPASIHESHEDAPNTDKPQDQSSDQQKVLTPPSSDDAGKQQEIEDQEDEDIGNVEPAEYWGDGKIPIFRPTMRQFRDFKKFVEKIDKYGMKSGIVKICPPQEWLDMRPNLTEAVKSIRIKNPIRQEFAGTHGTYTQANIEKQRTYSLPQWKSLCAESNHQPPAPRGERRRALVTTPKVKVERPPPTISTASTPAPGESSERRGRGRPRKSTATAIPSIENEQNVPPTPEVPVASAPETPVINDEPEKEKENEDGNENENEARPDAETPIKRGRGRPPKKARGGGSKPSTPAKKKTKSSTPRIKKEKPDTATSISMRRMNNRSEQTWEVDEAVFREFDYHLADLDQFTPDRCRELEDHYWKTINYGTPMYGADMPGSLFKDIDMCWNVSKLPNLLDVLGTNVPGVNTAYLYLGMWKATFAWHLEDVDLYSINYIHFGAPKQWYSISQEDARKFEAAMKSIWPNDAKHCDQFLRHKTYLISPDKLKSQFGINVNKLVHYEGEFVITYPYGYHSGFNLGYNCAESVNFANESWLNYGRIARKCLCESDSVWVDVYEIERKLRGEPTPEYLEYSDEEAFFDDVDQLPTPTAKKRGAKRKRDAKVAEEPAKKQKRVRIRVRAQTREPCILCPNDPKFDVLLPTDNGKMAHRTCALYTPETYVVEEKGVEMVFNVAGIDKGRWELKCNYCRSKKGAVFQCSSKKCARAYHATCAAPAGVQIDIGLVPTWGEDGTEYYCEGYDFRCRFHRPKRAKSADSESLEKSSLIANYGKNLKTGDVIQAMLLDGDIFGGYVLENRVDESACLVEVLPDGDVIELDWKWILVLDPEESQRPKPSPEAKPLPEHLLKTELSVANRKDGVPEIGDPFNDPIAGQKWAEFNKATTLEVRNPIQENVNLFKEECVWYYLGKTSTEARAQYTHDTRVQSHNHHSNFLDTVKPLAVPLQPQYNIHPYVPNRVPISAAAKSANKSEKPYMYKPRGASLHVQTSAKSQAANFSNALPPSGSTSSTKGFQWQPNMTSNGFRQSSGMPFQFNGSANYDQELLRQSLPSAMSPGGQPQQRYDNSPRQPNFYNSIHVRYASQDAKEFAQRYQALTQATQPAHSSLQATLAPQGSVPDGLAVPSSAALDSLKAHPTDPDLPRQSPTINSLPFTPPSQRPELTKAVDSAAAASGLARPRGIHISTEQFAGSLASQAKLGMDRFEQLIKQLGDVGKDSSKGVEEAVVERPGWSPISNS